MQSKRLDYWYAVCKRFVCCESLEERWLLNLGGILGRYPVTPVMMSSYRI